MVLTVSPCASYLWSTGATTQSIVATQGGAYSVRVTNSAGCSTTSGATNVTVLTATAITQQPQSKTIKKNTTTALSVAATGTGTLAYQWYTGTSPSTASPISSATTATYTTSRLLSATSYWVSVSGSCESVNSSTVTITTQ